MTINKEIQNRFKSPATWLTFSSAVLMIAGEIGLYEKIGIERQTIQSIIDFILLSFTTFGILNNPTSKNSF